jgi:hypothetical protein
MKFTLKQVGTTWEAEENHGVEFCFDILQKLGVIQDTPDTRYTLEVRKSPKVGFTRIKLERSYPKCIWRWAIPSIEVDEEESLVFLGDKIDKIIDKLLPRKVGSLYFKFTKI